MLKKLNLMLFVGMFAIGFTTFAYGIDEFEETVTEETDIELADQVSANALLSYDPNGSLFEKITVLEQDKVVAQLEKERAQLELDLERLNAERMKIQMELDTLSGRAEQQQHELEAAKTQLEIQTEKLKRQLETVDEEPVAETKVPERKEESSVSKKYKLINVVGVDNQLQATIEEVSTGQNKRISVGKNIDGYVVKSISLNEGIVFEKDGTTESLNIGK